MDLVRSQTTSRTMRLWLIVWLILFLAFRFFFLSCFFEFLFILNLTLFPHVLCHLRTPQRYQCKKSMAMARNCSPGYKMSLAVPKNSMGNIDRHYSCLKYEAKDKRASYCSGIDNHFLVWWGRRLIGQQMLSSLGTKTKHLKVKLARRVPKLRLPLSK